MEHATTKAVMPDLIRVAVMPDLIRVAVMPDLIRHPGCSDFRIHGLRIKSAMTATMTAKRPQ